MNTDATRLDAVLSYAVSDVLRIKNNTKIEILTDDNTSGRAVMLRPIRIQCAVG